MADDWVNIHIHSDGSVLDSGATVEKMLDRIKELGQPATALTDHGSMINLVDFHRGARARGIKPLLGMESYVTYEGIQNKDATRIAKTDSTLAIDSGILGIGHLVLVAKNYKGYQNLCRLSAIAHTDGYYYQPRIDYDILAQHKEGIIVSTACMFGDFSKMVDRGEYTKAEGFANRMKEMLGDDFYIEIQNHGFPEQAKYIPKAMEIARKVGANVLATQDCHYVQPEDWEYQDILYCIGKKQEYKDPARRRACKEMYIKSRAQMEQAFAGFNIPKSAFDNTLNIMHKVEDFELQPKDYLLPSFLGSKQLSDAKLKQLCRDGWKVKLPLKLKDKPILKKTYEDRVLYELAVISSMGFSDYFLIVQDFINWAKSNHIKVGPGRGSAAGCLVSYLTGITNIDPIEYDLMFERFLVPGRPTMPDIDVDVADRDSIIHYLEEKYGRDKISPLLNRTEITAKNGLIKVASVFGDYKLGQDISKLIKKVRGETPSFAEITSSVAEVKVAKQNYPKLFQLAEGLEGATIALAGHASGIAISSVPLHDVIPMHRNHDVLYCGYDKDQLSYCKVVKLDILGIDALKTLDMCVDLIKKRHGKDIDLDALEPTDSTVWDLINRRDLVGVFQFESQLMKQIIGKMVPRTLRELAFVNALGRPGALDNPGLIEEFVARRHGTNPVIYPHPVLEDLLKDTYGFMIYQEQIMKMTQIMASFSIQDADVLRKGCSDKKTEVIEAIRPKFMEGCKKNGYPSELATALFDQALLFAGYGFNVAHSTAYAYVAYQTAWLKTHYPLEYLVSCVTVESNAKQKKIENIVKFVLDIEVHGYKVRPPDVMKSSSNIFTIVDELIDNQMKPVVYYSLGAVKEVSQSQVEEWLKMKPFRDMNDAVLKAVVSGCTSKNLTALAAVGAFESIAPNTQHVVDTLADRFDKCKKAVTSVKGKYKRKLDKIAHLKAEDSMLLDLGYVENAIPELNIKDITQYVIEMYDDIELLTVPATQNSTQRVENEMEYLGLAVSGSLLDPYTREVYKKSEMTVDYFNNDAQDEDHVKVAGVITAIRKATDRNGGRMGFATISDGRSEARVLVFTRLYTQFQETSWRINKAIVVDGRKDKDTIIANDVTFLRKDSDYNDTTQKETKNSNTNRGHSRPGDTNQPGLGT